MLLIGDTTGSETTTAIVSVIEEETRARTASEAETGALAATGHDAVLATTKEAAAVSPPTTTRAGGKRA